MSYYHHYTILYTQAREALFGREITDYDCLARVRKALEPYANLWTTARDWAKLSNEWRTGSFLVRTACDVHIFSYATVRQCCLCSIRKP
jgi:hypothetical protein